MNKIWWSLSKCSMICYSKSKDNMSKINNLKANWIVAKLICSNKWTEFRMKELKLMKNQENQSNQREVSNNRWNNNSNIIKKSMS